MLLVKYINIGACFKGQKAGIAAGYLTVLVLNMQYYNISPAVIHRPWTGLTAK